MSFLNPVSEPVLRFSSTDADAPQINYAARTAGDVKAVLKACLVTGYGTKASAGWSIVNEVDNVCEFVSPSAAMSDYRLHINDTTTTAWSLITANSEPKLMGSAVNKSTTALDTSNAQNGWDLLATDMGFLLVENVQSTDVSQLVARITYFGRVKSALVSDAHNIAWWCVGHNAPDTQPRSFFNTRDATGRHYNLGTLGVDNYGHIAIDNMASIAEYDGANVLDFVGSWYLMHSASVLAQQPGVDLQIKTKSKTTPVFDDVTVDGRPALVRWPARAGGGTNGVLITSKAIAIIYLDVWGY